MGFNPIKSAKKFVKKALKSDAIKVAALLGAYHYGPAAFKGGEGLRGLKGWKAIAPTWLYNPASAEGIALGESIPGRSSGIIGKLKAGWGNMSTGAKAAAIGIGTAAGAKAFEPEVLEDKAPL